MLQSRKESKVSVALRANCFDASALLKRYVQEDGSETLRAYWHRESTKFTTSREWFTRLVVNWTLKG